MKVQNYGYRVFVMVMILAVFLTACGTPRGGRANAQRNAANRRPEAASIVAAADPETGILWQADFETGNYSQLKDGGQITISGLGKATITDEFAHSGRYAAALTITGANGLQKPSPGVRLAWYGDRWVGKENAQNLPDAGYYSAYYYFPQVVQAEWWNIMQWKQAFVRNNGSQSRNPVYFVSAIYANGVNTLILRSKVDAQGRFTEPGSTAAQSGVPLPTQRWVHLECYYRWSKSADGQIRCLMDGEVLWDVQGIITEFGDAYNTYPRQWTVNNYADQTSPATQTIYVDDLMIRLGEGDG